MKRFVVGADRTKFQAYVASNPDHSQHMLYTRYAPVVADYLSIPFSRYHRLSNYRLKVEIGLYQELPHNERLCSCDSGV